MRGSLFGMVGAARGRQAQITCNINGHIWEVEFFEPTTGQITVECSRCFPAPGSSRSGVLQNLF